MKIEIKNLHFNREEQIIFKDANLEFEEGFYLLKGKNGAGKTTLFNLITKKLKPNKGDIKIISENKIKNNIVYISQELVILEEVSIYDNVKFILGRNKTSETCKQIEEVLNVSRKQKFNSLSGGEKQIVHILINLKQEGNVFLVDEPFNNLSVGRKQIVKQIMEAVDTSDKIIILVDHLNIFGKSNEINIEDGKIYA